MKKITSLTLAISFLIMTYTGIMLFICPHGRVAYWSGWKFWGLNKTQYGELHTTFMLIFLFFGFLHIYYNWKPIVSYLKDKSKKISFTKKEFLTALGINILFIVGTLGMIQPFSGFLNFEESLKDKWTIKLGEPPFGHAELSKLKVFCKKMNIDPNDAIKKLKEKNIRFDIEDTLSEIANKNATTPNEIYNIIKPEKIKTDDTIVPVGLGRKTLGELESMGKIDIKKAVKILKKEGINTISPDTRVKEIADELDLMPVDIYRLIKK